MHRSGMTGAAHRSAGVRWRHGVMAVALLGGLVVLARPTAGGATTIPTWSMEQMTPPVTWVDDLGRQYLVASAAPRTSTGAGDAQLVVARNDSDGAPDPTWGTFESMPDVVGMRVLDLTPPAEGLERDPVVAIDETGVLSVTFTDAACNRQYFACDRWFTQYTLDGAPVGSPAFVTGTATPDEPLPDGSFIARLPNGVQEWRAPDGTDRDAPSTPLLQATVDHSGRLLAVTADRHVVRKPAGAPADLDLDPSCPVESTLTRVGRSAVDDSFATTCARGSEGLVVQRRDSTGDIEWAVGALPHDPRGLLISPTTALIDASGTVWVGGYGNQVPNSPLRGVVLVQPFDATGGGPVAYVRPSWAGGYELGSSRMITELRPTADGRVAIADQHACCLFSGGGGSPASEVTLELLPEPAANPTCVPTDLAFTASTSSSADVSFLSCPIQPAATAPLSYRVTVRDVDGNVVTEKVTDAIPGSDRRITGQVTGLPAGELLRFTVAAENPTGTGLSTPPKPTVLPFLSTSAFVERQYRDLLDGSNPVPPKSEAAKEIVAGGLTPTELLDLLLDLGRAHQDVEPTARLYRAYFLRDADRGGLAYWSDRARNGELTFGQISERFARSSEFVNRYGQLSNRQFVAKLYQNVFGRAADPKGLAYWTKRLDTRRDDRGRVVLQFSESSEGKRRMAPGVEPLATTYLMLDRVPTAAEREAWMVLAPEQFHGEVARQILAKPGYAARVAP
ncbi:MAG: hypothetical protein JWO77_1481 [Ilumatobacteraceae bacterium]|nr:hypothetical protein [Ilumatobacteraceae bacterium]